MADVYGERVGQGLPDTEWFSDAGSNSWVVLMKDDRIRYRPAELGALTTAGVRAFCLTNANLGGSDDGREVRDQLSRINQIATSVPGPYIHGVYADGVRPLWPK